MLQTLFHHRRAFQIENEFIRVTVLAEGGQLDDPAAYVKRVNGLLTA